MGKQYTKAKMMAIVSQNRIIGNDRSPLLQDWQQAECKLNNSEIELFKELI